MQATGIVRRIDDLGRIVIPKEVRARLHIGEGDPMELFMDAKAGAVIIKKYDCFADSRTVVENAVKFIANDEDISPDTKVSLSRKLKEALKILDKEDNGNA